MHTGTQHITFSDSARGTVRFALKEPDYSVISLPDDLGIGPIQSYDINERIEYFSKLCPKGEFSVYADEMKRLSETFRELAVAPYEKKVVWFSRRSVMEYAGFLEFLSRQQDLSRIEVVDLTDGIPNESHDTYGGKPYRIVVESIGAMTPEMVCAAQSTARPLREDEVEYYRSVWRRLLEENANLRTLWRGQLYSADEDIYDDVICGLVSGEWRSGARVVGEALGKLCDEYHQAGDIFIFSRLRHLVDMGRIRCRGNRKAMRYLEVKRNGI